MTDKPDTFIPTLTKEERALMRHALGASVFGTDPADEEVNGKNHDVVRVDSENWRIWCGLLKRGLAFRFAREMGTESFEVTELGKQALAIQPVVMPERDALVKLARKVSSEAWYVLSGGDDPRERCSECGAAGYGELRTALHALDEYLAEHAKENPDR